MRNCGGINKLPNAKKKRNVLASKLRPVKTIKGEKCSFTIEKVAGRHRWSYI